MSEDGKFAINANVSLTFFPFKQHSLPAPQTKIMPSANNLFKERIMQGTIFDIQRFSVHDGPGIRTTVFMKGCPLRCVWCHNPEGLSCDIAVQFFKEHCIGCNRCAGERSVSSVAKCPTGALKESGQIITTEKLIESVLKDRDFYSPDGGVTFSGGECLLQADFVTEALKILKSENISTAIDTCGYVPWKNIEKTLDFCDLYLYDIKCADSALHKRFTGKSNALILENLEKLSNSGKEIWVRVPIIPDFNDSVSEITAISEIVSKTNGITKVTLMPYHTLGKSKYETLGMQPAYETDTIITTACLERFKDIFKASHILVD